MTRKPDEWMPLQVRKYLGDTMHLTRDQHGAYMLLLMAYWMRGGPLTANDNELAAIARASKAEWAKLKPAIMPFFTLVDGKLVQKRAEEELARAVSIIEARTNAGHIGGKASAAKRQATVQANDQATVDQDHKENPTPLPIPRTKEQEESKKDTSLRSVAVSKPKIEIPEWIPKEAWEGFLDMRNKIRAKPTDRAILLLIAELRKMRATEDIGAVLDQSTMRGWKSVFPVKHQGNANGQGRSKPPSAHDNLNAGTVLYLQSLGLGADADADEGGEGTSIRDADSPGLPLLAPRLLA